MESPGMFPDSPMEQDDVPFPCKGCGEILEEGKAFELAGNRWHIECFCCSTCGTLLDSDAHLLLLGDGSLICSNCTYSCSSCGDKIEDLAILTGEQAFCAQCFRCRNCKRKIENLRYARTSQGIFCMDCHESLMQRRRKKKASAPTSKKHGPNVKLDKSLPSLPPEERRPHPTDESIIDHYTDDARAAAPALDAGRNERPSISRQTTDDQDNLILPSSTYRSNRHSVVPREAEADGGEFLIPVAFDPAEEGRSSRAQSPPTAHGQPQKSSRDGHETLPSTSASPHIAYQEKGRERADVESARWRGDEPIANGTARSTDNLPRGTSNRSSRSDFKENSSFSTPSPESAKSSNAQFKDSSMLDSKRSTIVETTVTLPSRPSNELRQLHEKGGSVDSTRSFPSPNAAQAHPKRGDSLESRHHQIPRKEVGARPPSVAHSDDGTGRLPERTSSRKSTPKIGEPPRTPRGDSTAETHGHARHNSMSTLQSDTHRPGSPSLLRYSAAGEFSMEEDMARILGSDEAHAARDSESFLRRVSHTVRHGRSFSDKGSRLSKDLKWPPSPVNGTTPVPHMGSRPASPELSRAEEVAWLRSELRKERQRVVEKEQKIAEMEAVLNATADVKQVNTELNEKRSTMVVLDAQKEIVLRELSVLTDHLEAEKRGASGPLDLGKITSKALRDFVESLHKLKESFTPQIEELVQSRNDAAEELATLNRMKDKSFQEFEQLSSKNAQLAELNNQLVHQIQELYKANSAEGTRGANGLGIYSHGKEKSLSAIDTLKSANSDLTASISTAHLSEEAEPATVVPGPQVVSIRKGQPRKFNWKKGGQNVAKGVTKGIKGAFMSSESNTAQDGNPGLPRSQTQDPSRQGFGFFGNQRSKQAGTRIPQADSVPTLAEAAPTGLFGTDLEQRMEHEKSIIPAIVTRCIQEVELRGMDMEGIYRKSGASSAIQTIREGFERSPQDYDISDPDLDIHAVTSALKQYFRKLPTPLITYEVYETIIDTGEITSPEARIAALQKSLAELPRVHQDVLEFLVFHLKRVVEREKENLMTSQNIAVVFAPTIMRPESLAREMTDVQKKNEVLKFLVENCQEVFMGMQS
ncbi:putative Rho GTPase activator Rga [Aspergillus clavatus NRRL 1]|uniref:Rho GTPase activator Rga, putative n=1 Tax=Aspergillus clavatus (strain ATCC 1007 / CBS 513.65 / DSM 816 / NCTC 3887 / NRRL 1 / QM 1276 / 107) TaxID=344612 RepID=A1CPJ3_ASPCL|nr:Rho GTPase activator Rga, putative [Aspergillus clavatus NRRL 1]EAW07564.1 Rho GTPase activator Rga, putative [Aspergillus clavatus NRRL 1]